VIQKDKEDVMITLKSSMDSIFEVHNEGVLIGLIRRQKGLSGDVYLASIDKDGEEKKAGKEFESPNDALLWIEQNR
jgi:hypothetical protein